MENIKLKTFTLRTETGDWLGQIIISSDGMFSGVTDYGNLSYAWRSSGAEDFREFLLRLNTDYFGQKLQNGLSYIVYNNNTTKACKRFAEMILPQLKLALQDDIARDKDWNLQTVINKQ